MTVLELGLTAIYGRFSAVRPAATPMPVGRTKRRYANGRVGCITRILTASDRALLVEEFTHVPTGHWKARAVEIAARYTEAGHPITVYGVLGVIYESGLRARRPTKAKV